MSCEPVVVDLLLSTSRVVTSVGYERKKKRRSNFFFSLNIILIIIIIIMAFTDKHLETFQHKGCAVVEDFISQEEISQLRDRIDHLLVSFDPSDHPMTTFSTGTNQDKRHIGNQYFLTSGDKLRYFLEESAVQQGKLVVDASKAVNKIGHGLHITEPLFSALTNSDKVRDIAQKFGYKDPRVLQSMVICKQPGIGGAVPMHQDSSFLFTEPLSACGFWLALEDCTLSNGCLEYVPGSHKCTPVSRRFVRNATDAGTGFVDVSPPASSSPLESVSALNECVPIEVKAGSLVLIHGQTLHRSSHNHSDKSRWIYTFHIVEGTAAYDSRNWLQMPSGVELTKL